MVLDRRELVLGTDPQAVRAADKLDVGSGAAAEKIQDSAKHGTNGLDERTGNGNQERAPVHKKTARRRGTFRISIFEAVVENIRDWRYNLVRVSHKSAPFSKISAYSGRLRDGVIRSFSERSFVSDLVFNMSSTIENNARLEFALPGELRAVVEQAAMHLGQTVGEFATATLVRSAYDVIEQHERTRLSRRDREVFLALLDQSDAEPNDALRAASEEYKRQMN